MPPAPIRVFFSYARADQEHLETLRTFAAPLTTGGPVVFFDDRDIEAGQPWEEIIRAEIDRADVVVVLLTAHFLASKFCMDNELARALRRQSQGSCVVVLLNVAPFVSRPDGRLASLQWFPSGQSITEFGEGTRKAWVAATKRIGHAIDTVRSAGTTRTGRPPPVAAPAAGARPSLTERMRMTAVGGPVRWQERAERELEQAFAAGVDDRAVQLYGTSVRRALRARLAVALDWIFRYGTRIRAGAHASPFGPDDRPLLLAVVDEGDRLLTQAAFELAVRLAWVDVQRAARDRLAAILAEASDAGELVRWLRRWDTLDLLDERILATAVDAHMTHTPLTDNAPLWIGLLAGLPESTVPDVFEVHLLLGRCVHAARLADSPAREAAVLRCAMRSDRLADLDAALDLPQRPDHVQARRAVSERAGDLLVAADRHAEALERYRDAGRTDLVSVCHERLGQVGEALDSCAAHQADRIADLVGRCLPEMDALVERADWSAAAARIQRLLAHLARAADQNDRISARREAVARMRAVLLVQARRWFGEQLRDAADGAAAAAGHYRDWSRFEEAAEEYAAAARLAQAEGNLYRAYQLFLRAELFGEADQVYRTDPSTDATVLRARAREAGGDLLGAARHYRTAGQWERAAMLFERASKLSDAAECLLKAYPAGSIDARLITLLRAAGDIDELVRRCVGALGNGRRDSVAAGELRRLVADSDLPAELGPTVEKAIESIDGRARRIFTARAQAWIAQARREVDERFAGIWGLDLGTSTCVVAIYDTVRKRPVLCKWHGQDHFASTLSIDRQGHELVGLTDEDIVPNRIAVQLKRSKRDIGTGLRWRVPGGTTYRPEEVAARLVREARLVVENALVQQVRSRVLQLARAELGEVDRDWLSAADQYDLRIERPRAVVTIPAYFPLKAKNATRDACRIAGVDLVRLIHEPTAACLAAGTVRRLSGSVVVVDLGAGTLDISRLDIHDDIHEVTAVYGDNRYGSSDFDELIVGALSRRLERRGVVVRDSGEDRRRLTVAAEALKIALSAEERAEYELIDFHGRDRRVTLTRAELGDILGEALATLRRTCEEVARALPDRLMHLILVGGPMLSPMVTSIVEEVFRLQRAPIGNPRRAVATGAALQGAVLERVISTTLLRDITPFALGIEARQDNTTVFSQLVPRNTAIPARRSRIFTTEVDNQRNVDIQVYSGQLDPELRIGRFLLPDLPMAPRGIPQIEVTFDIDESCVLTVTAKDLGTGNARSVQITDTTLLSPDEVSRMTERHETVVRASQLRAELVKLRGELADHLTAARQSVAESDRLWREFLDRRTAHRPGPQPLDARTHQILFEMHAPHAGQELGPAARILRDLTGTAADLLARTADVDRFTDAAALEATVGQAQQLAGELDARTNRLEEELASVRGWIDLLKEISEREPDPVRRFRAHHDVREYERALAAVGQDPTNVLDERDDLVRYLHCLAEVGDADRYRDTMTAHADRLGATLLDPEDPDGYLTAVAAGLVTVSVRGSTVCAGFQVGADRIVTCLDGTGAPLPNGSAVGPAEVRVAATVGEMGVRRVEQNAAGAGAAVVTLVGPLASAPLRLGHPALVRIGDRVWAAQPGASNDVGWRLRAGLVDRLDHGPDEVTSFRTGVVVSAGALGGPLLNDLGEVVGVLVGVSVDSCVAVAVMPGVGRAPVT